MNRKIFFLLMMIASLGLIGNASANSWQDNTYCSKPIFFYVGMSGGVERLMGRRTEVLSEGAVRTGYTTGKGILENNGVVSAIGGFLWKFPPLPVLMGIEGYIGRGNSLSSVIDIRADLGGVNNRYYSTDILRKVFYGGLVRIGYLFCQDNFLYVSLGLDRSQFTTKRVLTNQPAPTLSNIINRTRGYNGFLFGFGFEKHIGHFVVGAELRNIQYKRQNPSDDVIIPPNVGSLSMSFRPIIYSALVRFAYRF
ncbi:MAG: hypothetical protein K2Y18_04320 [Alphaproteobacteria bacterium]|jgi:hypothetical protein|nr:hypothetical protein [Alphaproteobacteria bacterium]